MADPVPAASLAHFTPAELEDLQLYAEQHGEALATVLARFDGVSRFTEVANTVRSSLRSDFVSAEWGEGSGEIVVRPGASRRTSALLGDAGLGISVVERDLPSVARVGEALKALSASLTRTFSAPFSVGYDPSSNHVLVTVDLAPPPDSDALNRSVSELGRAALPEAADTIVQYVPGSLDLPAVTWGGLAYSGCTGGFIVQSSGVRGISTAHHCSTKPSSYDGSTLGTTAALADRDVRWARFTSGTSQNYFQYNGGQYRAATAAGDPVVNSPVCKFGLTTGASCDTVESVGNCVTYSGWPTWCGIFRTVSNNVLPGDSGGPWYYGNTARGITSGYSSGNWDNFSGIGSLALLGVTVVTS